MIAGGLTGGKGYLRRAPLPNTVCVSVVYGKGALRGVLLYFKCPTKAKQMAGGEAMKVQILLVCIIAIVWVLSLVGKLSDTVALLTMGVGVGILFVLSEKKTE